MQYRFFLVGAAVAAWVSSSTALAQTQAPRKITVTTLQGVIYTDAEIKRVNPDGLVLQPDKRMAAEKAATAGPKPDYITAGHVRASWIAYYAKVLNDNKMARDYRKLEEETRKKVQWLKDGRMSDSMEAIACRHNLAKAKAAKDEAAVERLTAMLAKAEREASGDGPLQLARDLPIIAGMW